MSHNLFRKLVANFADRCQMMQSNGFVDVYSSGVYRREGAHWLLKDHTNLTAADLPNNLPIGIQLCKFNNIIHLRLTVILQTAVVHNLAVCDPTWLGNHIQNG